MTQWEITRERVLERDSGCNGRFLGGECDPVLDVHHIVPRAEGGTDEDANLMVLCKSHHRYLEALRRAILRHRQPRWRRCPHHHQTRESREHCERRLNAKLLSAA